MLNFVKSLNVWLDLNMLVSFKKIIKKNICLIQQYGVITMTFLLETNAESGLRTFMLIISTAQITILMLFMDLSNLYGKGLK